MSEIRNTVEEITEAFKNSTQAVGWYLHKYDRSLGGVATIRGPWHRWVSISEGNDDQKGYVADAQVDAEYFAMAINNTPHLIKKVEDLEDKIKKLDFELDAFGGWLIEKKCPPSVLKEFRKCRSKGGADE